MGGKSRTSTGPRTARWDGGRPAAHPAQWAEGLRVFRCVAAALTDDGQTTNSHFGVTGRRDVTRFAPPVPPVRRVAAPVAFR